MSTELDLEAIKQRAEAATEGPWHWAGNTDSHQMYLATWMPGMGRCTVMDFARWGMQRAKPMFVTDGLFVDGNAIAVYEVARNQNLPDTTSRSDPRVYRGDVVDLNHPDARFIAHARQDVPALIAEVEGLRAIVERLRGRIESLHPREVIAVHEGYGEEAMCVTCKRHWPCPTIIALEGP